ncbi:MAG: TolC family protein [Planctomycetaceae bacterium]
MDSRSQRDFAVRTAFSLGLGLVMLAMQSGCSRAFWRQQAQGDSYHAITERLNDERWLLPRIDLTPDTRSRFYDPYDPDHSPLPPDDPSAHQYMHCANGKEGYKGWHKFGDTLTVENPAWLEPYTGLFNTDCPTSEHANVQIPKVNLQDSIERPTFTAANIRLEVETVYLQALTLTGDRYILGTRFHIAGPGLGGGLYNFLGRRNGSNQHDLRNGIGIQQRLPSGAQFSVDVLNHITWNTSSGNSSAASLAWGITQPLLNLAGRKLVLENLTQSERNLLYEVRNMARFRQSLFTAVSSDYLDLQRQAQIIRNRENNIRQLEDQIEAGKIADLWKVNTVSDRLPVWPADAQIPDELKTRLKWQDGHLFWSGEMTDEDKQKILAISADQSYQQAAEQVIAYRETSTDSLGVLQLVTQLNNNQSQLASARLQLTNALDSFKIRLGLPPNVQLTVDHSFLNPYELIDSDLLMLVRELREFAKDLGPGLIPAVRGEGAENRQPPEFDDLKAYVAGLSKMRDRVRAEALEPVRKDFIPVRSVLQATSPENLKNPNGRSFATKEERDRVIDDLARDLRLYRINEQDFQAWSRAVDLLNQLTKFDSLNELLADLDSNQDGSVSGTELPPDWSALPRVSTVADDRTLSPDDLVTAMRDAGVQIREKLLKVVQSLEVVQAGLRVEAIALNRFTLPGEREMPDIEEVVRLGVENRHDLMNARAAVMDARRKVEVAANALKAKMDVAVSGNANSLGGINDDVNVSLDFKTPIDQVLQRNAYSQALVTYQRARREYMRQEDLVKQDIRESWRQLLVSQQRLEIDRQTVRVAALQYDNAALQAANATTSGAVGGGGGGGNNNLNLLNALNSVLNAQNSLVTDWMTYETNRLNIYRDMGIMQIDQAGLWDDPFYQRAGLTESEIPPPTELNFRRQIDTSGVQKADTPNNDASQGIVLPPMEIPADE